MARSEITPRAQQAIETKHRIIRVAQTLLKKKVYDDVSVNEISRQSGITVGTFYYYFDSKEDLLLELIPNLSSYKESDTAKSIKNSHSYMQLMTFFDCLFRFPFHKQKDIMWRIVTSDKAIKYIDKNRIPMIESIIERGQERGEFSSQYDSNYIARILFYSNRGIFAHSLKNDDWDYASSEHDAISRLAYSYLTEEGRRGIPVPSHE